MNVVIEIKKPHRFDRRGFFIRKKLLVIKNISYTHLHIVSRCSAYIIAEGLGNRMPPVSLQSVIRFGGTSWLERRYGDGSAINCKALLVGSGISSVYRYQQRACIYSSDFTPVCIY